MKTIISVMLFTLSSLAYAAGDMGGATDSAALARGKHTFVKYCSKCHGKEADGRGRDAYKYKPMPTNFHIALAARPYMVEITKKGGKAMHRSDNMPDWGDDLSNQQIEEVVSYLMSLRKK